MNPVKLLHPGLLFMLFLNPVLLDAQGTNKLDSAGSVGIGTINPTSGYLLDVRGNVFLKGTSPNIRIWDDFGSSRSVLDLGSNQTDGAYIGANYASLPVPLTLNVVGPNSMIFKTNNTERARISSTGYLGIGTDDPTSPLAVNGDSYLKGITYLGVLNKERAYINESGVRLVSNTNNLLEVISQGTVNKIYSNYYGGGTDIPITIGTFAHNENQLHLATSGRIGIGTTTPSEKLSVNGNISAKKIIVTQTGWSDYVFNADYKLMSLREVEAFVKRNRHLPEVPTAQQVAEQGISIGESQALLLKKIEELTLYMIALTKENQRQQDEIEKLKCKLNGK